MIPSGVALSASSADSGRGVSGTRSVVSRASESRSAAASLTDGALADGVLDDRPGTGVLRGAGSRGSDGSGARRNVGVGLPDVCCRSA